MADVNPKMPLVQFPFSAGIDEATRDEVVEAGAGWLTLENGRQDQRGGYSTRNGFASYTARDTDTLTPTAAYRIFADRDSLIRIADGIAQVYSATQGQWVTALGSLTVALGGGRVPEAACRVLPVPSVGASTATYFEDIQVLSGVVVLSWLDNRLSTADAYVAAIDAATGGVLMAPQKLGTSTAQAPALLASGGTYVLAVRPDSLYTTIESFYLDVTDVSTGWQTGGVIATDAFILTSPFTTGGYVVHSLPSASRIAVAYRNDSVGTNQLTVKTVDDSGNVIETKTINTSTVSPSAPALGANLGAGGDYLWVAWGENATVKACALNPSAITATALASTASVMTMALATEYIGIAVKATPTQARVFANDTHATKRAHMRGVLASGGVTTTPTAQVTVPNVCMVRKPFVYGTRYYSAFIGSDAAGASNGQQNFIVCDWSENVTYLRPVANPSPGLAVAGFGWQGKFSAQSTGKYLTNFGIVRSTAAAAGSALAELDFTSTRRWQPAAHGESTYLSGGLVSYLDGVRVAEASFLLRPPIPTTATSSTGITATVGWRYVCVYEEVDGDGNWHQSGISTPSVSTGAVANKTVTVTTTPLAITGRISANAAGASTVRVAFYRTLDGGTAPYYRLGATLNDTSALTTTYTDTTTDATLANAAKLYSQPGVVGTAQDHRPPPPFSCIATYNGMLVGASGSDVWFSGQQVSGEGSWFSPIFQVPVPGDGDITALWVMDGTLFVAKRREIYAVTGEPPLDNGNGGLGVPRRLAVDVGCIEQRSTCVTTLGTFFQSDRGIEILTRAQTVDWIGEGIQVTLESYPVVTSATVDPSSACVLIELAAAESAGLVTGSGRTLVYDLSLKTWVSTDRRTSSLGVADAPSQSACMIYTGSAWRYGWLTTGGVVHYETPGTHLDASGAIVRKRAVSANVKTSGMQGLQHINRTLVLARYHTPHDLNLSFAYNYNSTFETARLYTAADLLAITSAIPNMQLEHPMHDEARCEAVRVQLQDVTPSSGTLGTGQGATWISLCFEVVPQSGAYQLPDVSR